jgi:hypothetical protein
VSTAWRVAYALGAALIAAYFLNLFGGWIKSVPTPSPVVAGLAFLVALYLGISAGARTPAIWNSVRGADGRASTSKFQIFLWTVVVLFSYAAITAARWQQGLTSPLPDLPASILAALGISAGTATAAAAITTGNVNNAKEVKVPAINRGIAPIFEGDDGRLDLVKIQLISWTVLALVVFLGLVFQELESTNVTSSLPDIDPTLMVLTGLGSATYLGRKLVPGNRPVLLGRSPDTISVAAAPAARTVTISGNGFGSASLGVVSLGGVQIQAPNSSWTDTSITIEVPSVQPNGTPWPVNTPLALVVLTSTGPTQNSLSIIVTP